jgi:hypothetical protein
MEIKVKRVREPLAIFSGQITVNGEKAVVSEEITLAFKSEATVALTSEPKVSVNGEAHSSNGAH